MTRQLQSWTAGSATLPTIANGAPKGAPAVPLHALSQLLWRRKTLLLLAMLVGMALGVWLAEVRPRTYTAEGLLVIDTAQLAIPELSPVASGRTVEPWGGRSEARILTARETVADAVDELGLVLDPAFNPTLDRPLLARLLDTPWLPPWLVELVRRHAPAAWLAHRPSTGIAERASVIEGLRRRLDARAEERTYAIELGYAGPTPEAAAAVVNTLMKAYVAREQAAKQASLANARADLESRLENLGQELAAARQRLAELERDSGLAIGDGGTLRARSLEALLGERQALRIEQERVTADIARVDSALAGRAEVVLRGELVTPRLQQLWTQEAELVRELAEAREELGPRHPRIVQLAAERAGIDAAIAAEVRSLRAGLAREADLLAGRQERLARLIEAAEADAAESAEDRVTIELARQEVASLQQLYDLYRGRLEQAVMSPSLVSADARIVSLAEPPTRPDGPGRTLLAGLGGILGLAAAGCAMVARRWLGDRLLSPEDVVRATGLAVLGVLPALGLRHGKLPERVVDDPEGVASEALRAILARLKSPFRSDADTQVLLIGSPCSGDGKTSISLAMARVAAREGLRCLVVEGDCRRPGLRRALARSGRMLNDEKPGGQSLPYRILTDDRSGAHFLVAAPMADLAPSLLRSDRLRLLFAHARQHYDLVLIDGPPLLATADSLLLAEHADQALLVASAGRSEGAGLAAAAARLIESGCRLAGVVLNRCPSPLPAPHAYAGYSRRPPKSVTLVAP